MLDYFPLPMKIYHNEMSVEGQSLPVACKVPETRTVAQLKDRAPIFKLANYHRPRMKIYETLTKIIGYLRCRTVRALRMAEYR